MHKLDTNYTPGSKFKAGAALAYDKLFFEVDIFEPSKVVYKSSTTINTALAEDIQTFEDSSALSAKATKKLKTITTKVKSIVVNATDQIIDLIKVGDKVLPKTILFSISNMNASMLKGMDKEALEAIKRLTKASPKSKYDGTIRKITIFYNSEIEEMSKTLQELVEVSDAKIRSDSGNSDYSGKVNSTYSIQGVPLQEGQVEIKIYIDVEVTAGVGDKTIIGNQLKNTIGEVYHYDIDTESGEPVEALFGSKSLANRIVNSPYIIGTTTKLLEIVSKKAVDIYNGS